MSELVTTANLTEPDAFYADLLAAHEGLGKPESDAYNARLILLMANQIGDRDVLRKLLDAAHAKRDDA
ncbi:DUF2783 domain-containing protein [Roseibium salinum]|uniref:DUF2783 domain-containing protein n=1 Tax=Roseibium salinum TaxID=1604349 RepID=A0ABT3R359_9HYPH|nr:DUF2783 domain-containing protein [Roseibium sp. DSM 29163]MCX2723506.1 DUF2783 domain-containing protein [Roseibium sp. DSM 29163]MDN3718621.1 DUF2783 domain-containing protein [Roseibium salinum]